MSPFKKRKRTKMMEEIMKMSYQHRAVVKEFSLTCLHLLMTEDPQLYCRILELALQQDLEHIAICRNQKKKLTKQKRPESRNPLDQSVSNKSHSAWG